VLLCIERLLCPSVTNIDLGATFPGENMVQGKNTLGYLLPAHSTHRKESTLSNTHRSQNVWHIHLEKCKKKSFKGILSTSCVIFSYPTLLSISVLTFIKWRLNTELLMNTHRNVVFSTKKADHRYRKLINDALTWARPTLFTYLFVCQ
jgi:hypothetical protein